MVDMKLYVCSNHCPLTQCLLRWRLFHHVMKQLATLQYKEQPALRATTLSFIYAAALECEPSQGDSDAACPAMIQLEIHKDLASKRPAFR